MLVAELTNVEALREGVSREFDRLINCEVDSLSYNELGFLRCVSSSAALSGCKTRTKQQYLEGKAGSKPCELTFTREELMAILASMNANTKSVAA